MNGQSWFGRKGFPPGPGASGSLVMVGNFDGFDRGHCFVLERGIELARERALVPLVLTFDPHPSVVLGRGQRPVLTPLQRKIDLLTRLSGELGIVVEPFTRELAAATPLEFARDLLLGKLSARLVTVGQNFRFGHGRAGDAATLATLGGELGFEARAEALHGDELGVISSTRIRALITAGKVGDAERLLGRPHALSGQVERGEQRARQLGVPSANLAAIPELLPARGVYACLVDLLEGSAYQKLGSGVANIGVRPTLGEGELKVEVHVLGFAGDLYGRTLRIHLVERLRDELRFNGLPELQAQLDRDKLDAAQSLCERRPAPDAQGAWH